jgi:hypothetical protein
MGHEHPNKVSCSIRSERRPSGRSLRDSISYKPATGDFDANRPINAVSVFRGLLYRLAQAPKPRPADRRSTADAVAYLAQNVMHTPARRR